MPCRPTEYGLSREEGENLERFLREAIAQRHQLRELLLQFMNRELPPALQKELGRIVSEKPEPCLPRPEEAPRRYAEPVVGNWALHLMYAGDREMKKLCEARTLLAKIAAVEEPPLAWRTAFDEQMAAHRKHRGADLEALREFLRRRLSQLDENDDAARTERADLLARLASAERLTVDEILADRSELEELWPKRPRL